MNTTSLFSNTISTLFLSFVVIAAGCSNPASSDDDPGHTEPYGLELIMNGETIIEYFNDEVTGNMKITEGDETSSITVEFLNAEREHIHDEHLDDDLSLSWNIENDDILGVEQHEDDGRWNFHLVGKSAGTSKIQLQLMHGDHADFETPAVDDEGAIEIQVEASSE